MGENVIFTAKGCLRSVWKHPFLVCTLFFWTFMYRLSPVIFSLFVSASPVFVCTAVLLGALLSFGGANVAKNKVDDRTKHFSALVACGASKGFNVGEIAGKRSHAPVLADKPRRVGGLAGEGVLVEKQGIESGKCGVKGVDRKIGDGRRKKKKNRWSRGSDRDVVEKNDALNRVVSEHLESDYEKSEADSFDSERVNVDSPPCSPWGKVVENLGNDGDGEEDTLDSGSEESETSSPDASMSDMMPMLDELHPLLDEEAARLVQMSLQGSHATSDMSLMSSTSGNESDVETNEDIDAGDYDDDMQGNKDRLAQPAITWTEEDQKNLQDLGSSEIERNQRLETLMQRRQERKFKSMVSDMNFIDMESANSQFNLAPISTSRQNPFSASHDAYDHPGRGLPIPGSAPSILAQRRNPFDTLSVEDKSKFQAELGLLPPRETFFRKQDNFITGPSSVYATSRQGKQNVKMTPYFVPESTIPAASSYSPFLQPSSGMSSRLSSMPETTSVSSAEDLEDQRLVEEEPVDQNPDSYTKHFKQSIDSDDHYKGRSVAQPVEAPGNRYHSVYKKVPSTSSFSESRRMAFKETVEVEDDVPDDGSMPSTAATSPTDEVQHKAPVYDSSPPSIRKNLSSNSFNLHSESPLDLLPLHIKRTISMIERHYERISRETDKDNSNNATKLHEPSTTPIQDNRKSSDGQTNGNKPGSINSDSSKVAQSLESCDASTPSEATNVTNSGHLEGEKHPSTNLEKESLSHVKVLLSEGQAEVSDRINRGKTIASKNNDEDDDDDDDVFHEAAVKISTPSVWGSTTATVFSNVKMRNPIAERLEEVQVPNTPIDPSDKFKAIPNLNIPNIHELIDTTLHVDSPYTPNVPSMPSSASKETGPHFSMETILEEVQEIKEIEGDVYWQNRPTAFDKYLDTVLESSSSDGMEKAGSDNGDESATWTSPKNGSHEAIEEKVGFVESEDSDIEKISRVDIDKMDDDEKASESTTIIG